MEEKYIISVICPVRNEEQYIGNILQFFQRAFPKNKELIIADGASTDNTKGIVQDFAKVNPGVTLIDNTKRYVPFALNECIRLAKGKYIVRLDAHTEYDLDYFEKIIAAFEETGAEIVGGPMRAKGNNPFQRAVATCTSTLFGVGDSKFHNDTYRGFTDSVYLGAWHNKIFQRTGLFDEEMCRNQDDEFHYRAKKYGLKIFLDPAIKSWYFPRSSFKTLMKQYFQYGLFKPLVMRKVKSEIKLRHLIPSVFLLYILSIPLISLLIGTLAMIPLLLYFAIDLIFSLMMQDGFSEKILSLAIYPALHIAYGSGFILGLNNSIRNRCFRG